MWQKIDKIEKVQHSGNVYNLEVAEDHTYYANDILVHNCRSMVVPITKYEKYKLSDVDPLEPKSGVTRGEGF